MKSLILTGVVLPNGFVVLYLHFVNPWLCLFRSQAAKGKEGLKDGVSEMGTRLDPVPGLPGGESADKAGSFV